MKSVMNVIVTTYTIAICWVRERDKKRRERNHRRSTGWESGTDSRVYIWKKKKKSTSEWARESNGLGWSAACHMVELTRTEVTMIPAWLGCPSSPLLHSLSLIHSFQNSGTDSDPDTSYNFNLDLDVKSFASLLPQREEKRKAKVFLWWQPVLP